MVQIFRPDCIILVLNLCLSFCSLDRTGNISIMKVRYSFNIIIFILVVAFLIMISLSGSIIFVFIVSCYIDCILSCCFLDGIPL